MQSELTFETFSSSNLGNAFKNKMYTEKNQEKIKEILELAHKKPQPVFKDFFVHAKKNRMNFVRKHNFQKYRAKKLKNNCSLASNLKPNRIFHSRNSSITESSFTAEPLDNRRNFTQTNSYLKPETTKAAMPNSRKKFPGVVGIFSYSRRKKRKGKSLSKPKGKGKKKNEKNSKSTIPNFKKRRNILVSNSTAMVRTMHERAKKLKKFDDELEKKSMKGRSYYSDKYYFDKSKRFKINSQSLNGTGVFYQRSRMKKKRKKENIFQKEDSDEFGFLRSRRNKFKFLKLTPWAVDQEVEKDKVKIEPDMDILDKINSIDEYVKRR